MADEFQLPFPLTARFKWEQHEIVFANKAEFFSWCDDERGFWGELISGIQDEFRRLITRRLQPIFSVNKSLNDSGIQNAVAAMQESYVPSTSRLGVLIGAVREWDMDAARITFALITGQTNPNQVRTENPSAVIAIGAATIYNASSLATESDKRIRDFLDSYKSIQNNFADELRQMREVRERAQGEWAALIDGYETKARLGAPRKYWEDRKIHHEKKATPARFAWNISMLLVVALTIVLSLVLFTPIGNLISNEFESALGVTKDIADKSSKAGDSLSELLRPALVFGVIVSLAIWWMRQKLKELRSHEHLAEDAAERVTMIETYSAMKGSDLSPGDISLMLSAIYRSAATGLVEDDNSGPVTPLEIAVKGIGDAMTKRES